MQALFGRRNSWRRREGGKKGVRGVGGKKEYPPKVRVPAVSQKANSSLKNE